VRTETAVVGRRRTWPTTSHCGTEFLATGERKRGVAALAGKKKS
jgi:hypothetical protein